MALVMLAQAKHPSAVPAYSVYVGRNPSVGAQYSLHLRALGNPFRITVTRTRDQAVKEFRAWLWEKMQDPHSPQTVAMQKLLTLAQKQIVVLVCHCYVANGQACHSTIIAHALRWMENNHEVAVTQKAALSTLL